MLTNPLNFTKNESQIEPFKRLSNTLTYKLDSARRQKRLFNAKIATNDSPYFILIELKQGIQCLFINH
jgi:hypothetical protein